MIKVEVFLNKAGKYQKITIKGHANSDEYGKDLVCAGVSSIVFGALNAIDKLVENKPEMIVDDKKTGLVIIDNINDDKTRDILDIMIIQLETIEEMNSDYIKIIRK